MADHYGGDVLVGRGTVFSLDGRFVITAGKNMVSVYSSSTGIKLVDLIREGIVKLISVGQNSSTLVGMATKKKLEIWDFDANRIVGVSGLPKTLSKITDILWCASGDCVLMSCTLRKKDGGMVLRYNLTEMKINKEFIIETESPCSLITSPLSTTLGLLPTAQSDEVVLISLDDLSNRLNVSVRSNIKVANISVYCKCICLQCVCLDAMAAKMAVGCSSGMIFLYSDVTNRHQSSTQLPSHLHWHASEVRSLKFSSDGRFLHSIGEEGVLVTWELENTKREFVPRLGSPALGMEIHPINPSLFLIPFENNSFKIIDSSSYKASLAVYGLSPRVKGISSCPYCIVPTTDYLALLFNKCAVQFYDLTKQKHIGTTQVIWRMNVSRTLSRASPAMHSIEPYIQSIVFNAAGSIMVAVTIRSQIIEGSKEAVIKFLQLDSAGKSYVLHTEIQNPHKEISDIAYSPTEDLVVTIDSGHHGDFKLWRKQEDFRASNWICSATGSYRGNREGCLNHSEEAEGNVLGSCCFSEDGSLLALGHSDGVSMWDPTTLCALGMISLPEFPERSVQPQTTELKVLQAKTLYLIRCTRSPSMLVVYNLESLDVEWALEINSSCLAVDATFGKFAAAVEEDRPDERPVHSAAVFDPSSSTPIRIYGDYKAQIAFLDFCKPGSALNIEGQQMENGVKHTHAPLLVLTRSHRYFVETETGRLKPKENESLSKLERKYMISPFEKAFGASMETEDAMDIDKSYDEDIRIDFSVWRNLPSHELPSTSVLLATLISQIDVTKN